ncbi:kinesin-like protein KIF14 [Notothenia coriiceps]|uniref:Kinesin-like protein KIF14 n=1 Tax=Notothenia coriiceps TaxID=8208 RepID=A0A6I9NLC6_9TELE|nr:PREDICTED: kinesin-like protein KIF14 [Notothenia coriiceps]
MSLFSVQARKHTAYYDQLVAPPRTPGRERPAQRKSAETTEGKLEITSRSSACEDSRSSDKSRKGNRTYVVSVLSKSSSGQQTPYRGRLTLQRRSRRKTGSETAETTLLESSQSTTPVPEKRLTLQRRTRTPSMGKSTHMQRVVSGGGLQTTPTVLSEPNGRAAGVFRSTSLRESTCKSKGAASVETQGRKTLSKYVSTSRQLEDQAHTFKTPTKKTPFGKIAARRDVFEKLARTDAPKPVAVKSASLERPKSRIQQVENTKPVAAPRVMNASSGVHKISTALQVRKTSTSGQKGDASQARTSTTPAPPTMHLSRSSEAQQTQDSLKMENSAVTVAVRLRPFNAREKAEKALQVIYMNGQETAVQHPGNKQRYNFTYDFSFCSVDDCDPTFASQQTVYKTLAKPLLLRAFEGFNTCLFAYGQTGSGKSYTMMGFGEEEGVIPRFCQELFSRLASMENEEVKCHVEMSLLEVYNEKIHDLLVTREQINQRRVPLRVREHPVNGPYVADLSANIVSSYNDVQGWLALGNKQRATAATGMNDKSSRSHSVLTLVMTQTQTEFVEGEEHDHSITSRINLVDLAGSERCKSANTSGDRLREGASINKSLLTLGKVISALSEQSMTQKTVFIPYRESVLTCVESASQADDLLLEQPDPLRFDPQGTRLGSSQLLYLRLQAMEEHHVCQAKIVDALEAEKRKIGKELEEMQKKRALRENHTPRNVPPQWDAMKLSLMIEEANKISAKLKKNTVFSRHESSEDENVEPGGLLQVRVQNRKLGITTFWSLDKFQNNIAAMRELDQGDSTSKDDDVFYDPDDEWEQDISASSASTSSFSRRRSRSLLKSRRISGRLYEIRVHPIQSLHNSSSQSAGLMGVPKPPSTHSSSTDTATPGICKELIGQSVARLRSCSATEESMADRLASDLHLIYEAVQTISDLYDSLDDDSQENVFVCNLVAQTHLVKATAAIEGAALVTMLWLAIVKPSSGRLYTISEELKSQVKKMGGFFQLLIQGCESEITSMVTEAKRKSSQCLDAALLSVGHLAAVTGTPLNVTARGGAATATGKKSGVLCLLRGTDKGVHSLLKESFNITREMLRDAQLAYPRNPVLQSLKSKTLDLACALQNYMNFHITERESSPGEEEVEREEGASASHLQKLRSTAAKLFQLNHAISQLHSCLSTALRGNHKDSNLSSSSRELISSSAKAVDELITGLSKGQASNPSLQLPFLQSVMVAREELHSALQSLSSSWDQQEPGESRNSSASDKSTGDELSKKTHTAVRNRVVSKMVYYLPPGVSPKDSLHWV